MMRNTKKAFTLIELLVVVAIISLLVSILLPSLNKAKDLAKQAACLSNIRNMGLGFGLYRSDCGDYLPARLSGSGIGGYTICAKSGVPVNYGQLYQMEYCALGTLYCPADRHFADDKDYIPLKADTDNFANSTKITSTLGLIGSYMYLWRFDLKSDYHYVNGTYPPVSGVSADFFKFDNISAYGESGLRSTSATAIMCDVYVGTYSQSVHMGGCGCSTLFADGHAKFFQTNPPLSSLKLTSSNQDWLWQEFDSNN